MLAAAPTAADEFAQIGANLAAVRARIAAACRRAQRPLESVTLVAVSKTHPPAAIAAAAAHGQRDFGENRLPELREKIAAAQAMGLADLRWHFIGALQSRQTHDAVGPQVLLHAVDRHKIAERLSRDAQAAGLLLPVLLEVNTSGEASKHGFAPAELRRDFAGLLSLPGLQIQGLMTMAPLVEDAEQTRPVFRALAALRDELVASSGVALPQLSMGMSNDYEVAIEEGATLVRIGTAIFGVREAIFGTRGAP